MERAVAVVNDVDAEGVRRRGTLSLCPSKIFSCFSAIASQQITFLSSQHEYSRSISSSYCRYISSSISFEASTHEATTLVALTHLQHPHRALVPDEGPLARVTVLRLLIAHLRVTVT